MFRMLTPCPLRWPPAAPQPLVAAAPFPTSCVCDVLPLVAVRLRASSLSAPLPLLFTAPSPPHDSPLCCFSISPPRRSATATSSSKTRSPGRPCTSSTGGLRSWRVAARAAAAAALRPSRHVVPGCRRVDDASSRDGRSTAFLPSLSPSLQPSLQLQQHHPGARQGERHHPRLLLPHRPALRHGCVESAIVL